MRRSSTLWWQGPHLHTRLSRSSGTAGGQRGSGARRCSGPRGGRWRGCHWTGSTTSQSWGSAVRCRWAMCRSPWGSLGLSSWTGGSTRSRWPPRRGPSWPALTGAARPSLCRGAPPASSSGTGWRGPRWWGSGPSPGPPTSSSSWRARPISRP